MDIPDTVLQPPGISKSKGTKVCQVVLEFSSSADGAYPYFWTHTESSLGLLFQG